MIICRQHFQRLLSAPKSLRDQLLIELPTLEGFRTGEVSSLRAEYVDYEHGDLTVLDSKRHQPLMIPLDPIVATHLEKYVHEKNISAGLIFPPGKPRKSDNKTLGEGLSLTSIERAWQKWCRASGVPIMSPRWGRAYFAANWHLVERKSMYGLMAILRHDDILATQKYLARIIDYLSIKDEFAQGKRSPSSQNATDLTSVLWPLRAAIAECTRLLSTLFMQREFGNES